MIFAILPVKAPQNAKQRLSAVLDAAGRERLARLLYEHMLETVCAARGIDRILVVTSDPITAEQARRRDALVLAETEQVSHSRSADAAAKRAIELGAATVALLPIDVPLVTPADIETLLAPPRPALIIVPSADGSGTNALVRTPPDIIESRFGPGSFQAHLEQAQSRGIEVEVRRPPGLIFDLDTPEDLMRLRDLGGGPRRVTEDGG